MYDGGTQNAGPAIRVNAGAGRFMFYGLVALYVPAQTGIALVLYHGEPLSGIGTVIDTQFVSLIAGDILRIEADSAVITTYRVKVNGLTVMQETLSESQISALNPCVGFVQVFDAPVDTIPPPGTAHVIQTCPDTFTLTDPFEPFLDGFFYVDDEDITMKSGSTGECHGAYYVDGESQIDNGGPRGSYIEFQFVYGGTLSGMAITGVCWRVNPASTADNFTGWVVLFNEKAGKLQIGYYINESLANLPANIVFERVVTFPAGTLVNVYHDTSSVGHFGFRVIDIYTQVPTFGYVNEYYNDEFSVPDKTLVIPPGDQLPLRQSNTNWGHVVVGVSDAGLQTAKWVGLQPTVYGLIE